MLYIDYTDKPSYKNCGYSIILSFLPAVFLCYRFPDEKQDEGKCDRVIQTIAFRIMCRIARLLHQTSQYLYLFVYMYRPKY